MGNQVTTLGQIYSVEYYLLDYCADFTFDANLGSTRFMKVARVKHKDIGYCVAKVYAINDPSIQLFEHKHKLEQIRDSIKKSGELHSLPFLLCLVNDKSVVLIRQYIKYNLYDRLSTRPFLTQIEKRWIAYQLLRCVQSLHKQSIYHGDIKSENVLVTSFLWITLADFASYKPLTLPENNPSDFSYFFDTSRRHCCNMAPERFVEQTNANPDSDNNPDGRQRYSGDNEVKSFTPQMDLFSLGCLLAELFSEDPSNCSIFDLGQILMFKKGQYDPVKFVEENISDTKVRRLILNLTDLDPSKRNSVSYHLDQLVPSLFPAYFQNLYDYFTKLIPMQPDHKILILDKDLDKLMEEIITEYDYGLLIPMILITSCLRSITSTDAKLTGIKLCVRIVESSPQIMSEFILDRILPYIIYLMGKSEPRVKALCVASLNSVLKHVDSVQPSDSHVFIDYILPSLLPLTRDISTLVRISLAANVSELAETAKRFLNLSSDQDTSPKLTLLRDSFGQIVSNLLEDPNNNIRRALLNENISKLCDFFGPDKTDEIILSHLMMYLNDKSDFRLRVAFFDCITHIISSVGADYSLKVKPMMQKSLADSEETVIYKCVQAISSMTDRKLLAKDVVYELFQEVVPLLSFPNKWIRNSVINFVLILTNDEHSIDFNKRLLPAIKLHLHRDIHGLRDEAVLLDSLQNPLPRIVIDSIMNGHDDIDEIFHTITKRKMARDKKRYWSGMDNSELKDFDSMIDTSARNQSGREVLSNVDRFSEDKLIDSELILRKIQKNKRTASSKQIEPNISIRRQDSITQSLSNMESLLMSSTVSLSRTSRPKGILLAHLHEHKAAVNKLVVIPGTTHFISCSNDATIKSWDCAGVAVRPQVLFRSKQTFISPDAGAVTTISTCMGVDTLLALTESNNLHLLQLFTPSSNTRLIKSVNFNSDLFNPEYVTDLVSLSPYTYATCSTSSYIRGYDLRLPTTSYVWNLKMDGSDGLITCLDGNESCVACGTSSSVISMFDLRFYIRATTMSYPPYQDRIRKRIRRIMLCNDEIYCSVDGNNEVSTWDCESAARTKTLWASPAPCLSSTQSSHHSVLSMIVDSSKDTNSIITAGSDMKIRFWDLANPHRSYVVSRPPQNSHHKWASRSHARHTDTDQANPIAYYQVKLVDGIQVVQETDKNPSKNVILNSPGRSAQPSNVQEGSSEGMAQTNALNPNLNLSDSLASAHHDSISCLATVSQSNLLLSASREGVIKIWR